ncbi:MAG: hypothetical protein AB1894_20655 [Chloroflexota bacterium]
MTLLRHPVERFLSHFYYWQQRPGIVKGPAPLVERFHSMSLDDFVNCSTFAIKYNMGSIQTRQLGRAQHSQPQEPASEWVRVQCANDPENTSTLMLERAKCRLSQLAFWGLTERFQDGLFLLSYTFGWRPPRIYSYLNATANRLHREQIAPHILAEIEKLCETDTALYQYARQGFEARFQQMSEVLLHRYSRRAHLRLPKPLPAEALFELLEQHYIHRQAIRHKLSQPAPPNQSVYFTFEQAFSGDGWHARKYHSQHGVFCWSGPGAEASLDFIIEAEGDQVIQFRVLAGVTPEVLGSLVLSANGRPIPLLKKPHPGGGILFHGYLPQSLWAGREVPLVCLTFQVAQTLPANVMNPELQDISKRGIALKLIEIKPAANDGTFSPLASAWRR